MKGAADKSLDLICMGRVAVDLYAEQIGSPLKDAQTFRKYLGGCAGNIAVGSARLGLKVAMLSAVGNDAFGDFIHETLVNEGIDVSLLQRSSKHLTGLVVLGVCPPAHFPLLFFRNECADLYIERNLIKKESIQSARALLVTGTAFSHPQSAETTRYAMDIARDAGTKIIFDIDYRPVLWGLTDKGNGEQRFIANDQVSDTIKKVLPCCDVIVGTEEEIAIASGCSSTGEAVRMIQDSSKAIIVVKKGLHGAVLYDQNQQVMADAYPIPVLNVLGAGDAFMSGFLSAMLSGLNYEDALKRANACGALVVARHGCAPAMPSLDEVRYFQHAYTTAGGAVMHDVHLAELHRKIGNRHEKRCNPLPILAFCHRWQFEESCKRNNQPYSLITTFKTLVAQGFIRACSTTAIEHATILTDPHYGKEAIALAQNMSAGIIAPIEESKCFPTSWIDGHSCYETLLKRPASWGVKLLWPYHEALDEQCKASQIASLKELFHSCNQLERKLMLELVAPPRAKFDDADVIAAVTTVYEQGIKPYWWKLQAFSSDASWQALSAVIDDYDPDARVVVLGGECTSLETYREYFSRAQSTHHGIGFAVGRSIFWPSWEKFVQGQMSHHDVEREIAENFISLYQQWRGCRG